ncbi:unnamed protein product [Vicia faba]|uniref:Uncharacterized protein n=1 Tax=Vicia faba TaxID=3906 RepID=A0AAV1A1U8_VICFA|nr:unnamed protein product [Vicia faba]
MLENLCVQQREHHEEETYWRAYFEAFQEECYLLVQDHLTSIEESQEERYCLVQEHLSAQDNSFNVFETYVTDEFSNLRRAIGVNHGATTTSINRALHYQDENHYHYSQFYQEMCDFLNGQNENNSQGWHRGVRPQPKGRNHQGQHKGCRGHLACEQWNSNHFACIFIFL